MATVDALIGLLIQTPKEKCPDNPIFHLALPHAIHVLFSGRGRFGQVHKCEEKATGLKLAAKIIKTRGTKDKVKAVQRGSLLTLIFASLKHLSFFLG